MVEKSNETTLVSKELATEAALRGLDFLVRHQVVDFRDANSGRFLCQYDCSEYKKLKYTTNWMTGICTEVMLAGHKLTGKKEYLDAAEGAVKYIASLQYFAPEHENMHGLIREITPQSDHACPRDALTAAWAMLDFSEYTGQEEYLKRSELFAEWFMTVGMEKGYPYWKVFFDEPWLPSWFGSFQSGGAFYFYRLFNITGKAKYKDTMLKILDHYNKYHLEEDGQIHVAVDMETYKPLAAHKVGPEHSPLSWEIMHAYNDDFGALANLAGYKLTKEKCYLNAAQRFLRKMVRMQRQDGGFGPEDYSVPSAGGSVLLELKAAEHLGLTLASDEQLSRAAQFVLDLQVDDSQGLADGAFRGVDDNYEVCNCSNSRTAAYSIMALLRYADVADPYYFFSSEK